MKTPVPMPTARQAELYDRYKQYIHLERDGPPIEVLKAAKALVKEEDLNPYHAVHLHMKLAAIPEIGLHHATEGVRTLTQLRKTDDSKSIMMELQEATRIMKERGTVEKAWLKKHSTMTSELKEATVRKRYFDYFSDLEKDQPSHKGKETEEQDLSTVKKARTTDSGSEKGDKEKEMEDLYEDARAFLAS
ncbi:hypothetical protein FGLOB1_2972 [Fusarium globosum]|uniref:Uncharacterized protein n=1 Tax=Fusarium globosum TaxID=78864 RepID=A0A8H5YN24_9HYPO|nr:hypothetical protein FGLOB1_2972 [Fusarium globosum]